MGDVDQPSALVQRLHQLRVGKGMTINQMAASCGLPKSSLESYMRMSGAKRPGIDALISIAEGMSVSLDWLVGRTENIDKFEAEDYAVFCHSVVQRLLHSFLDAERANAGIIDVENWRINGQDFSDIAAHSAIDFMEVVNRQRNNPKRPRDYFKKSFDSLARKRSLPDEK